MKKQERPTLGLYIHIPFCRAKCAYCDFYSLAHSEAKMDQYVAALSAHLIEVAPVAQGHTVDTVYFGGGTPSYLGSKRIIRLVQTVKKHYHLSKDAEITMEANPDSAANVRELRALSRAGINRISLGVQSSDDAVLHRMGRVHTWQQVTESVAAIRKAKIDNISLDLIYGLPDQTMEQWEKTLSDAVSLHPRHLSCYGLKVEEGTPLWKQRAELTLPDDDLQADMYLYTVEFLRQMGYEQYEISNFAQPGKESRHNLKYWQMGEYAGFGPGAHSDFGGVRYAYVRDLDRYLRGELILSESETIETQERAQEYLMLGLRTTAGIDRRTFENRYRRPFGVLERLLEIDEAHGLCQHTEGGWRLTPQGFLVSNQIIGQLEDALLEEEQRRRVKTACGNYQVEVCP